MVDTRAHRGIVGVMTPAMDTVVQPELELLRPHGITGDTTSEFGRLFSRR